MNLRERNCQDAEEIKKLNFANEQKSKESADMTAKTRGIEYEISSQMARIEEMNKLLDVKANDLKSKESLLLECEGEIIQLKNQVNAF